MVKIDIISGFLGAGKTTLIKKLLQEALQNSKVVLIENEFGEIGIDGGLADAWGHSPRWAGCSPPSAWTAHPPAPRDGLR